MIERIRYYDYLKHNEVEAFTDAYSYDEFNTLYFISILGNDSAVKAISSALVNKRDIDLCMVKKSLSTGYGKYRILSSKLENGILHQIVISEEFFERKLLYVPKEKNEEDVLFELLQKHYAVPLIEQWKSWLFVRLKEDSRLTELNGTIKVLNLEISEAELESLVQEGVSSGKIRF